MKNAISYVRVSTKDQALNGIGLDVQQCQIDEFARLSGYNVKARFREDGASAMGEENVLKRPAFQAALNLARETGWPIIVSDLSRASRHTRTLEELFRSGRLSVISAKNGEHADPVVIASEARRAQREGELIGERTRAALALKKQQGIKLGNTRNIAEAQRKGAASNRAAADDRAGELIPYLLEAENLGLTTAAEIARLLNQRGHRPKRGSSWTVGALRRPLKRARQMIEAEKRKTSALNPNWGIF